MYQQSSMLMSCALKSVKMVSCTIQLQKQNSDLVDLIDIDRLHTFHRFSRSLISHELINLKYILCIIDLRDVADLPVTKRSLISL